MRLFKSLSVPRIIVLGFLGLIALTTALLSLPVAQNTETSFVDALFTAVSAVCVTGLVVVNTAGHWSLFGKIVILVASQIGALGFMTFVTLIFLVVGRQITLKERMVIQQSMNQHDLKGMVRLVKRVLAVTFLFEGLAALCMSFRFMQTEKVGFLTGLWYGLFHAVCAFCSAGFDILQDVSLSNYVGDPVMNFSIMGLVLLGSIGYTVWIDILSLFWPEKNKKRYTRRLSLQSRIVLEFTLALTLLGTLFFLIVEYNNPETLSVLSFPEKMLAACFQSVTPRTLGYHTVDPLALKPGSQLMIMVLMAIGGSPGSTCGGIKTVTLAVIMASVYSVIKGRDCIVLHKRNIAFEVLEKSLAVVGVYIMIVLGLTIALTFTEASNPYPHSLTNLLFESISAAGTVGLSMGVTPHLSAAGKLLVAVGMFLGRIGGVTVAISLSSKRVAEDTLHYPEGKLMVG